MKAFWMGLGIGAAIGLLFAPQEGAKTRAALRRYGGDVFTPSRETRQSGSSSEISESEAVAEVLNTASKHDLMSVEGIGKGTAKRIVMNRPYETVEEVVQEGILPEQLVERVKEQLVHKSVV